MKSIPENACWISAEFKNDCSLGGKFSTSFVPTNEDHVESFWNHPRTYICTAFDEKDNVIGNNQDNDTTYKDLISKKKELEMDLSKVKKEIKKLVMDKIKKCNFQQGHFYKYKPFPAAHTTFYFRYDSDNFKYNSELESIEVNKAIVKTQYKIKKSIVFETQAEMKISDIFGNITDKTFTEGFQEVEEWEIQQLLNEMDLTII